MESIYLDYNATTPIDREVADAMQPYLYEFFGNPSSTHSFGIITKEAVNIARKQMASLINAHSSEIIFTSGGTESNNYAIKGVAFANKEKGNHIITSQIEHPAVTEVCKFLEENGFQVTYLPVDEYGMVNPMDVKNAITPQTILVSIMHANNEVGTIQPIQKIGEITRKNNILFHTDAAQSLGKIEVDVNDLNVDLLSVAGHKLYAPKGIGALYVKSGTKLKKLIHGADHEMNQRAGTENVLEIVGLGKACEIANRDMAKNCLHLKKMRNKLQAILLESIPEARINGHPEFQLPNTLSISFPTIEANTLLAQLPHVAASAGAACHTGSVSISSVLKAMNVPLEFAMGTIRLSTGKYNSSDEIEKAGRFIINAVKKTGPM
ncbi:MAG: IscS subfamily cysteine desulfurase [Bacteroidales bacterium]